MSYKRVIRSMVLKSQDDFRHVIAILPTKAMTVGQRVLQRKHGSPKTFANGVISALGEISVKEANDAIKKISP